MGNDVMNQFKTEKLYRDNNTGDVCRIANDSIIIYCKNEHLPGMLCAGHDGIFAISDSDFYDRFEEHNPLQERGSRIEEA